MWNHVESCACYFGSCIIRRLLSVSTSDYYHIDHQYTILIAVSQAEILDFDFGDRLISACDH